jgi:hypothetical protein
VVRLANMRFRLTSRFSGIAAHRRGGYWLFAADGKASASASRSTER